MRSDEIQVGDAADAFIVDHHIKALGPIGIVIDGIGMQTAVRRIERDLDEHVRPSRQPLDQNILLMQIVVRAASDHQHRPNRPIGIRVMAARRR